MRQWWGEAQRERWRNKNSGRGFQKVQVAAVIAKLLAILLPLRSPMFSTKNVTSRPMRVSGNAAARLSIAVKDFLLSGFMLAVEPLPWGAKSLLAPKDVFPSSFLHS